MNSEAEKLPKEAPQVPPEVGKKVEALKKELSTAAAKSVPKPTAKDLRAEVAQLESPPSGVNYWLWGAVAALVLAAAVGAWWFWRKKRAKTQATPAASGAAAPAKGPDLYADWRSFYRGLPRTMRRVLDDFQPVVVLGNLASEKERVALQLSGVDENERLFPGRVTFRGKGLEVYLGSRSLVVVPTDAFLRAAGAETDAGWRKVVRYISRVRAPRVVVCLSQAPIDADELDEITAWASTLRGHADLIAEVRNEDIEVSVALAQATQGSRGVRPCLTDAFFELLHSMSSYEGIGETLKVSLNGLADSLPIGTEERREAGESWTSQRLLVYRRGWPRLLAHAEEKASHLLHLAERFENFRPLTAGIGAALAELFVLDERKSNRTLATELIFLPTRNDALVGTLQAFSGPQDVVGRWHPSQRLLHRIGVATGTLVILLVMWLVYLNDKAYWDQAATAADRYQPPEEQQELETVRNYVLGKPKRPGFLLPEFFERELLRCMVVRTTRSFLMAHIEQAIHSMSAPENVLQLVALYASGSPENCNISPGLEFDQYAGVSDAIEHHIEQWRQITELNDEEILGYLELACPLKDVDLGELEAAYGNVEGREASWQPVPDAVQFAAALQGLRGECRLTAGEKSAIERAERVVDNMNDIGERHGAALSVLRAASQLNTPVMTKLSSVFETYEERLLAIEDLANEREDIERLVRDVRPFSDQREAHHAPSVSSAAQFNELLGAYLSGEVPEGEDVVLRMTFSDNTYVINRKHVRSSLLTRALAQLTDGFTSTVIANELKLGTSEAMFFSASQMQEPFTWIPGASIPRGIGLTNAVPWRYTLEGFQEAVLLPLERMRRLTESQTCGDGKPTSDEKQAVRTLGEFVQARFDGYLVDYSHEWQRVYDSFLVTARSDSDLIDVLTSLSRPTSPQLSLLREVLHQTTLTAAEGSPYAASLGLANDPFEGLAPAINDKVFLDYQSMLQELANAAQADGADQAAAGAVVPASAPARGGAAAPAVAFPNAEQSIDAFASNLTGFSRVVVAGLRDPKEDLRARVHAWIAEVGLAPGLRRPLLEPVDAAYASGQAGLQTALARFWEGKKQELDRIIGLRFPFSEGSTTDAAVTDVVEWLTPGEGRFFNEVQSIYDLVNHCGSGPCVSLPPGMRHAVVRMNAISKLFFDDKGQPAPLVMHVEPMAFANQRFAPKRASLKLGVARHEYFNTQPRASALSVAWNESYTARLETELVGEPGIDSLAVPIQTEGSPWAMFRLLQTASSHNKGHYYWDLDVTGASRHRGRVSVSYRVCQDVTHCAGLFTEALEWE